MCLRSRASEQALSVIGTEVESGAETCLHVSRWQCAGQLVGCAPPRTVPGHNDGRVDGRHRGHGLGDDRFEGGAAQVQAPDERVDLPDCLLYTSPSPRDS